MSTQTELHAQPGTGASAGAATFRKPDRSFWQIWNMSFGFFGIQFGWGLQMANMSAIYEYLGARADQIPILWLAAPLTGLLIQPIIGHASDRTWGRLGRRRPYFLAGAILSSLMLILMPNCAALWMAAGMLWILDASINVSMEPFRAFVADILPEGQRTSGFCDAEFVYRTGRGHRVGAAVAPDECVSPAASRWGRARDSDDGAAFVLHRGCRVSGRGAVDDCDDEGVSTGGSGGISQSESGEVRAGSKREGDCARDCGDAGHDAQAGAGAVVHLVGAVLHVAVFPGCCGAQRFRRARCCVAAV
jgi:hypothetical protein